MEEMRVTATIELSQEKDTWDSGEDFQVLEVVPEFIDFDDGYLVIKTERWAINNISEFIEQLEKVKKELIRIYPEKELAK